VGLGGPDSLDDNSAAAHIIPVLPFLALYLYQGSALQRVAAIVSAPFIINMLILCNSRGATIGMALAMFVGVLLMGWRLRLRLALMVALAVPVVYVLVDQSFIERQLTLFDMAQEGPTGETVQGDGAANERIQSWMGALTLVGERPLGVGGGGYDLLSPVYAPDVVENHEGELRAVHNTYLWAASDWGIAGFAAFAGFIVSGLLTLHRIRRETKSERMKNETLALEVALIAFLGAAFFVNRMYAEILYWLVALSASLANIHDAEAAGVEREPAAPKVARAA
jgi:MFS family permease